MKKIFITRQERTRTPAGAIFRIATKKSGSKEIGSCVAVALRINYDTVLCEKMRILCPKTNDILPQLRSSSESDTDEAVYGASCGSPLSTPKNRSDDRGSRRGELWCIYGTSVRVAVIKRAHFLPLLQSLRVSFPSISSISVSSILCSLSVSLGRARLPSSSICISPRPSNGKKNLLVLARLRSQRSTFDNLYLRRHVDNATWLQWKVTSSPSSSGRDGFIRGTGGNSNFPTVQQFVEYLRDRSSSFLTID